jgi:hypothetical protein
VVDNAKDVLIYLDHNVIDKLTKSQFDAIFNHLSQEKILPVYSDENLEEIQKSKGYENKSLSLLKELGAVHLRLEVVDFRFTGKAAFETTDPFEAYSKYISNKEILPEFGYGLSGMLRKFYGGIEDKSFTEILNLGANELVTELDKSLADLQSADDLCEKDKIMTKELTDQLKEIFPQFYSEMGKALDNNMQVATAPLTQIENIFSVGPKILNNIKGPDIIKKIWAVISKCMPANALTLEKFFGLTPDLYGYSDKRALSQAEKVNALYHQLNFLGYYRDAKMNDQKRFNASFSDKTHAGYAIFCHYFMSMDENLIMKTTAAYEYLGVFTKLIRLKKTVV